MSALPRARESKAICCPSGDQRGVPVTLLKCVSWTRLVPSLRHIQISYLPLRVDSKAILLPSGEYCGPLSIAVEDRNRSAGSDECFESSCFRQMFRLLTWRAYTRRLPRIDGSVPSWPNCSLCGSPPRAEIFQSQPDFASQPALPKTMSRPSEVQVRPHPNCEPVINRRSSPPATGMVYIDVTPCEPRLNASI